ncbi:LRR receptor-like serine threonine-protein kinase [Seminavis robusta]|uniref:LRR receptor-like serine threonine-protein kinase n=1 Tax=Seminavis robusta TaxID=568900 RepID=A0A9N8HBL3_9STRA|nr:LRR receptor-like serine threonine-protein kinase [Seminavis robusta]|eukprot:Sro368_g127900.1 LRR receptor-like serine threonine-protein kinase (765) ;mRNA; r:5992-8710
MMDEPNSSFDYMIKQATSSVMERSRSEASSTKGLTSPGKATSLASGLVTPRRVRSSGSTISQVDYAIFDKYSVSIDAHDDSHDVCQDMPVDKTDDAVLVPNSSPEVNSSVDRDSINGDGSIVDKDNIIDGDLDSDIEDGVKAIETCTTNESNENEHTKEKPEEEAKESTPRPRRPRRPTIRTVWLLWCFVLAVLILAAAIAVITALGFSGEKASTATDSSSSANNSDLTITIDTGTVVVLATPESQSPSSTQMPSTLVPTSAYPSEVPSVSPSAAPTTSAMPSDLPSDVPSIVPTQIPSVAPTMAPTVSPQPTGSPSFQPSDIPSDVPSDVPSNVPSDMPSEVPSFLPSASPSYLPSSAPTQHPTTAAPTVSAAPTFAIHITLTELLMNVADIPLEVLDDPMTPQGRALQWMATEDQVVLQLFEESAELAAVDTIVDEFLTVATDDNSTTANSTTVVLPPPSSSTPAPQILLHLPQRFAIIALDFSLHADSGSYWSFPRLHECQFPGVTCDRSEEVIGINWARQNLTGYVVPEISLLTELETLDLAQNQLTGFLDPFWSLPKLKTLYLFENQFFGSIGPEIGNMYSLEQLYLGNCDLTGSLPEELFDLGDLRYLILSYNDFTGTLPDRIRMTDMYYWDLSHTRINGTLPSTMIMPSLRHFHMDNALLTGSIPNDYANLGSNRLFQFYLNDNQLTGAFPTGWHTKLPHKHLTNVDISNNQLSVPLPSSICMLTVYEEGETVEFRADCDICVCGRLCYRWCDERFQ